MTLATTGGPQELAPLSGYEGIGLEDVGPGDMVMPRMVIDGPEAKFTNSTTKESYPSLTAILLALIKQRVMWREKVTEDPAAPQCKSTDFAFGYPNMSSTTLANLFPWNESVFDQEKAAQDVYAPKSENGLTVLPCGDCSFKEWEDGATRCKELYIFPMLYLDTEGIWTPAVLTIKGSGIKNAKSYVAPFAAKKEPLFTSQTTLTLTPASRQAVRYAIPNFKKTGQTDQEEYENYARTAVGIREMLRRPPMNRDADEAAPTDNTNTAPPETTPAMSTPPATQQVAPQPPVAQAPVAPASPPPPSQAVASTPAVSVPVPAATADGDDDLPF